MKTLAILRVGEEETPTINPNTSYPFMYDEQDNFYILTSKGWIEETSTAFDFIKDGNS